VPDFTILPLLVPSSISDADAADFIEYSALDNLVYQEALGSSDFDHQAAEELPDWRIPGRFCEGLVAKIDDRIVGAAIYSGSNDSSDTQAYVLVDPAFRRQGIGSALFERITERARVDSRLVLQGHLFDAVANPGERVDAVSGVGSISRGNPGLAFILARGGALEQVGRVSRVVLPLDPQLVLQRDATARNGYYGKYELIRWEGATPDEFLDDLAVLLTRMSTDPPAAGLEQSEDVWDADRLRAMEDEFASSPRQLLVVAARDIATGKLVGYTQLNVPAETHRSVDQWATLVLDEHRGHKLGLALKLENLLYLEEVSPGHPSVVTMNAAENKPMLDVNESVGFVAIGWEGNLQLRLPV
jgi:GNAT superfamily N-acetyltransferase